MQFDLWNDRAESGSKVRCKIYSEKEIKLEYIGIRISCHLKTAKKDYCLLSRSQSQKEFTNITRTDSSIELDIPLPEGPISQKTEKSTIYWTVGYKNIQKDLTVLKPKHEKDSYLEQFKIPPQKRRFRAGSLVHLLYVGFALLFIRKGIELMQMGMGPGDYVFIFPFLLSLVLLGMVGLSYSYYFNRIKDFLLWLLKIRHGLFFLFNPFPHVKLSYNKVGKGEEIHCVVEKRGIGKLRVRGLKVQLKNQFLSKDSFTAVSSYAVRKPSGFYEKKGVVLPIYSEKKFILNDIVLLDHKGRDMVSKKSSSMDIPLVIPREDTLGSFFNEENHTAILNYLEITIQGRLFLTYKRRIPIIIK